MFNLLFVKIGGLYLRIMEVLIEGFWKLLLLIVWMFIKKVFVFFMRFIFFDVLFLRLIDFYGVIILLFFFICVL